MGYDALEAAGGEDALRLMKEYKSIGLLLTDVVMPGMNGRKLAEEAAHLHPGLKVLYMTGYSRNAIVHQGRLDPGAVIRSLRAAVPRWHEIARAAPLRKGIPTA
jgi:CheY-like chemotaxis protein